MSNHYGLSAGLLVLLLATAGSATAEPGKISSSSNNDSAIRAFGEFAHSWMSDMEQRETTNRSKPTIKRAAGGAFASYTGYSSDWDVEVHATGDQNSPFVGILRYEEQRFTCKDQTTSKCSVSGSTPVTEVFPYRNGRWKY